MNPSIKMSHIEIAGLINKRSDNVKRAIESLIATKVISQPQVEDGIKSANGVTPKVYVFTSEQGKRDSLVVVAQLCPEFTAKLVDHWYKLEQYTKRENINLNDPHSLRRALLEYTDRNIELESQNTGLERSIQAITQTSHGVKFQQACKILSIKRHVLAEWLRSHGWDRHLNDNRASTHYSQEREYCETKYSEVTRLNKCGELYSYTQIDFFILPKGMAVLAKHFGKGEAA